MTARHRARPGTTPSRARERADPTQPPEVWPNGSGFYRQGTAHRPDKIGLLGRTVSIGGGKHRAWRFVRLTGQYTYLGIFNSGHEAMEALR